MAFVLCGILFAFFVMVVVFLCLLRQAEIVRTQKDIQIKRLKDQIDSLVTKHNKELIVYQQREDKLSDKLTRISKIIKE